MRSAAANSESSSGVAGILASFSNVDFGRMLGLGASQSSMRSSATAFSR
jgi:hypothetical protein